MRVRNLASITVALVAMIAIHSVNFHGSVPRFRQESGGELFDTKISRSAPEVFARLEAYGPRGRAEYQFRNVTTDIVLPLSLLPLLVFCTARWRGRRRGRVLRGVLAAAPFVYLLFDLAENAVVYALIARHPRASVALAELLPWLTTIKRIAVLIGLASLVASGVAWGVERLRKRGPSRATEPSARTTGSSGAARPRS